MRPLPYVGPRPPVPPIVSLPWSDGGGCASTVHTAFPVTASTAKSLVPELKYITPSITNGVSGAMYSERAMSNDHALASVPTFDALI